MAAESVGQIGLDLVVNQQGFDKQVAGIQGLAKKAGLAIAAVLGIVLNAVLPGNDYVFDKNAA